MYSYPLSCAGEAAYLFKTLTGAEPLNVSTALQAGWAVQGWAQSQFVPTAGPQALADFSDADGVAALAYLGNVEGNEFRAQGLLDRLIGGGAGSGSGGTAGGALLQLLLPLLLKWLQSWLTSGGLQKLLDGLLPKPTG